MRRAPRKRTTRQLEQVFKASRAITATRLPMRSTGGFTKAARISLATVYRNLHSLVEEGKIRTLLLDEQGARFDPETSQHDHFVCTRDGRVVDLFLRRDRQLDLSPRRSKATRHDARPDGPWDLSGLCRSTPRFQISAPGDAKGLAERTVRDDV